MNETNPYDFYMTPPSNSTSNHISYFSTERTIKITDSALYDTAKAEIFLDPYYLIFFICQLFQNTQPCKRQFFTRHSFKSSISYSMHTTYTKSKLQATLDCTLPLCKHLFWVTSSWTSIAFAGRATTTKLPSNFTACICVHTIGPF